MIILVIRAIILVIVATLLVVEVILLVMVATLPVTTGSRSNAGHGTDLEKATGSCKDPCCPTVQDKKVNIT